MIALRDQKGMTLVEVLVGAALVAMLVMPTSLAIYHFISLSHQGNARLTALHNIQNAARIISRDGQMAESTDLVEGAEPVASLGLAWLDRYAGVTEGHTASYRLTDNNLERTYDGVSAVIARHISSVAFSRDGGVITMTIAAQAPGSPRAREEKTYTISPRPSQ